LKFLSIACESRYTINRSFEPPLNISRLKFYRPDCDLAITRRLKNCWINGQKVSIKSPQCIASLNAALFWVETFAFVRRRGIEQRGGGGSTRENKYITREVTLTGHACSHSLSAQGKCQCAELRYLRGESENAQRITKYGCVCAITPHAPNAGDIIGEIGCALLFCIIAFAITNQPHSCDCNVNAA
jgi:hypothetical protein